MRADIATRFQPGHKFGGAPGTGRPRIIKTLEELEEKIESYFEKCDEGELIQQANRGKVVEIKRPIPYTVPDLAYHLGYASRNAVWDLAQIPIFTEAIQRALTKIEGQRVRKGLNGEQNHHMAQFDLINNFKGYRSTKSEQTNVNVNLEISDADLDNRLALLEGRVNSLDHHQNAPVIEGDFQVKLLK